MKTGYWILLSLEDDFDLEAWYQKLSEEDLKWPEDEAMQVKLNPSSSIRPSWAIVSEDALKVEQLLHQSYQDQFNQYCLWWTQGSERVPACLLVTSGLPQVSQFSAMLDGNWQKWGWQNKQIIK